MCTHEEVASVASLHCVSTKCINDGGFFERPTVTSMREGLEAML